MSTDQQSAAVASMLSPQYVEFKEQIRTEMFTIKQKMNELRASHGKATLTSFDDSNSHDVEIEVWPDLGGFALQSGGCILGWAVCIEQIASWDLMADVECLLQSGIAALAAQHFTKAAALQCQDHALHSTSMLGAVSGSLCPVGWRPGGT